MSADKKANSSPWLTAALVFSLGLLGTVVYVSTDGFSSTPFGSEWLAIIGAATPFLGSLVLGQHRQNHNEALAAKIASEIADREHKHEIEQAQVAERRTTAREQRVHEVREGHAVTVVIAQQLIDAVLRESACLEDPQEWLKFTVDGVSQPTDMEGLLQELNAQPLRDLGQSAAEAKTLRHACKEMVDRHRQTERSAQMHRERGEDFTPWKGKWISEARHGTYGAIEALAALAARRDRTIQELRLSDA